MLLDLEQQKLARELGEGHRIIYGVAGSGKTVVLLARAKYLARKHDTWKILFLCFNKILSQYLERVLQANNYSNIFVSTYHSFAIKTIKSSTDDLKGEFLELENRFGKNNNDFYQKYVPDLFNKAVERSHTLKYDAILVDEGQDFNANWFRPLVKILNPMTNSLLIAIDGLQNVYKRNKFSWSQVNIDARGRTKYFDKSYRNPRNIGEFAREFLLKDQELSQDIKEDDELIPTVDFIREGGEVKYFREKYIWDNRKMLADYIKEFLDEKLTILVLFKKHFTKESGDKDILLRVLGESDQKFNYMENWVLDKPGINICSIHGAKGLEADVVVIPDIEELGYSKEDRKLCYVAMTRATKYLIISARSETTWTNDIEDILRIEKIVVPKGCCISCSRVIDFDKNLHLVRCKSCWSKLKDELQGKYCHICGKKSEITTFKPLCNDCYAKLNFQVT